MKLSKLFKKGLCVFTAAALSFSYPYNLSYAAEVEPPTSETEETTSEQEAAAAPETEAAPETTESPETTQAPETTTVPETTASPEDVMSEEGNFGPDIYAKSYCVLDGDTGEVLYSKCMNERHYPASTTKIMTALLVFENVEDLDAKLTFSQHAIDVDPSSSTLEPKAMVGEVMSVRDVLHGMLLKSGNECAVALAEYVGGTEEKFVEMMNARAQEMGLQNTHFTNSYGIHNADHYTTAYDLARILQEAMKNERYRELNATKTYTIQATNMAAARELTMGHAMINGAVPEEGVIGGKTGSTPQALKVLATACDRDGLYTISTLMCTSAENWYTDGRVLLEYTYGIYNQTMRPFAWVETDDTVKTTGNLRVHYSPSMLSNVEGTIATGTEIHRLAIYEGWSKIIYNGNIRYVSSEFLDSLEPEKVPETEAFTTEAPTTEEETSETDTETAESTEKNGTDDTGMTYGTNQPHTSEGAGENTEEQKKISLDDIKMIILGVFGLVVLVLLGDIAYIVISRKRRRRKRAKLMSRRRKNGID